ncbi:MAG: LacI family DNA-binding transcriptional regulator [Kiritimatiellae bacterium]|jgi:LacI family transcriptional regulator|nr:LacI family DNA-binding transcriptional regulator [Kiritimatiellia bacterium]
MQRRVTIKNIAEESGVAASTVADILRKRPASYKPETVKRIKAMAKELGYVPNALATSLSKKQFQSIAMIQQETTQTATMPTDLLKGLDNVFSHNNYRFSIHFTSKNNEKPDYLKVAMHDGILLNNGVPLSDEILAKAKLQRLPILELNVKTSQNCIYPDDFEAAERGTQHLINLGHKKTAFVHFNQIHANRPLHYSIFDREAGYMSAIKKAKLSPSIIQPPYNTCFENIEQLFFDIFSKTEHPTALVFYATATKFFVALQNVARKLNFSIPEDISVLGFTGSGDIQECKKQISTMNINWDDLGRQAGELLLEKIKTGKDFKPIKVALNFEEQDTIAKVRSGKG